MVLVVVPRRQQTRAVRATKPQSPGTLVSKQQTPETRVSKQPVLVIPASGQRWELGGGATSSVLLRRAAPPMGAAMAQHLNTWLRPLDVGCPAQEQAGPTQRRQLAPRARTQRVAGMAPHQDTKGLTPAPALQIHRLGHSPHLSLLLYAAAGTHPLPAQAAARAARTPQAAHDLPSAWR